jgi:hypothetical protein
LAAWRAPLPKKSKEVCSLHGARIAEFPALRRDADVSSVIEHHERGDAVVSHVVKPVREIHVPVTVTDIYHDDVVTLREDGANSGRAVEPVEEEAIRTPIGAEVDEHKLVVLAGRSESSFEIRPGIAPLVVGASRSLSGC